MTTGWIIAAEIVSLMVICLFLAIRHRIKLRKDGKKEKVFTGPFYVIQGILLFLACIILFPR